TADVREQPIQRPTLRLPAHQHPHLRRSARQGHELVSEILRHPRHTSARHIADSGAGTIIRHQMSHTQGQVK
ncbi:hypothetical protein ACFQ07_26670, partial [Actinomadura adrarensis]